MFRPCSVRRRMIVSIHNDAHQDRRPRRRYGRTGGSSCEFRVYMKGLDSSDVTSLRIIDISLRSRREKGVCVPLQILCFLAVRSPIFCMAGY